ncbi:NAD(P)-binding Rossmann-fold superfamily protein [Striga hermonthica]|uniref:NAD(P)-binding Rossmann-fold superfamily protein n=1 Tax=Striga hermonthica TaxID=68872 RepID=A0A9N7NRF1_STRHE|nr:NAD(P)-binding Rossmann-fold superfamily protein [Striga hermonthica]
MLSRPQFAASNGRIFWGWFFLMIGSFSFMGFVYAAVVSKLQPPSDNAIIRAIQNDCISSLVEHETVQACVIDFGRVQLVTVLRKNVPLMKATLKYLAGIKRPSGYGSKTTAHKVAQDCFFSMPKTQLNAIITGATSGIGAETARVLAMNGVRIIIPARDLKKANDLKKSIQKECPKAEIIALEMDLSSLNSIQRFSSEFSSLGLPLHILINNAGKYSPKLEFSGHFVLTQMLLEKNGGNSIRKWHTRENCQCLFIKASQHITCQGISKTAQDSLYFVAAKTKLLKSTTLGAATTCYPKISGLSGKYFSDCNESRCSGLADEENEAHRLWTQTRAFVHRLLLHKAEEEAPNVATRPA